MKIENFQIQKQLTPRSCGFCTIAMVCSFLNGNSLKEKDVKISMLYRFAKNLFPFDFRRTLETHLHGYTVEKTTTFNMNEITGQLKKNLPVPFIYSTPNMLRDDKRIGPHYAAITGLGHGKVVISNPFGYSEELDVDDVKGRMAFHNYQARPVKFKIATFLKIIKPGTIFVIKNSI